MTFKIKFLREYKRGSQAKIMDIEILPDLFFADDDEKTYKSVNWMSAYLPKKCKNYVAKVGPLELTEIELLKKISKLQLETMIELVGIQEESLLGPFSFIIFEKADSDLENSQISRTRLAESFRQWAPNVLGDLLKLKYAFLDWKPANVLVYVSTNGNIVFKLTDFGSAKELDIKTTNSYNVNFLFSSPFVSSCYDVICPKHSDDQLGLVYIYLWLTDYIAPWMYLKPKDLSESKELAYLILMMKTRTSIHLVDKALLPDKWMCDALTNVYDSYSLYL